MVYEQKLLVLYSCLLYSIVFATLFLPFSIAFFIACNQNNSRNRQTANANKLTKAKERNLLITAHWTLTSVWPSCFLRGHVCCTDYRQQNGVHATVFWVWTSELGCTQLLEKKEKKENAGVDLWIDCKQSLFSQWSLSSAGLERVKWLRGSFPLASCFLLSLA